MLTEHYAGAFPACLINAYRGARDYVELVRAAGFAVDSCAIIPRQTPLASGMAAWLTTFRTGFLDALGVGDADRDAVIADTVALLAPMLCDADGNWIADYVRLRFAATKPE